MRQSVAGKIFFRVLCIVAALSAPAVGFFLVLNGLGYRLSDYAPAFPNDEVLYFLQAAGYASRGFGGGYFTVNEVQAPAAFLNTGVHGPLYPMLYGTLGRHFGLTYTSAFVFHLGLITASIIVYIVLARPTNRQLLVIGFLFLTYWPLYNTLYSWMQEPLHIAIAVVCAGIFTFLLRDSAGSRKLSFIVPACLFLCGASLVRISWALLLPPFFVLARRERTHASLARAGLFSALVVLLLMYVFRMICAPYVPVKLVPVTETAFMMNKLIAMEVGPGLLLRHIISNLFKFGEYFQKKELVGSVTVVETLVGCLLLLVLAVFTEIRRFAARKHTRPGDKRESFCLCFNAYNLGSIIASTILVYFVGNGGAARIFAIHLFLSFLVLLALGNRTVEAVLAGAALLNLVLTPLCLVQLTEQYASAFSNKPIAARFHELITGHIGFDERGDGWANTLITDRLPGELVGLPTGIGVSFYFDPALLKNRVKSRYIIAQPEAVQFSKIKCLPLVVLPRLQGTLNTNRYRLDPVLWLNLNPTHSPGRSPYKSQSQ